MEDDIETIAKSLGVKRKHVHEMTVGDLKEECGDRGLKVSGKKHELVERLARSIRGKALPTDQGRKRKEHDSDDGQKQTKKAKKATTGPMPIGIPSNLQKDLDVKSLEKYYKDECRDFHKMVNDDWHDGYEEQGEYLSGEYFGSIVKSAKAICTVLSEKNVSVPVIKHCYEVTLVLADSKDQMCSVPMRGEVSDALWSEDTLKIGNASQKCSSMDAVINFLFLHLLTRAIEAGVPRAEMMPMIKGAVDYDFDDYLIELKNEKIVQKTKPNNNNTKDQQQTEEVECPNQVILQEMISAKNEWENLPSRSKVYKQKGVIDRRFSGPKHKRTRDYSSDGDDGDNCVIC
jgi:hypothetical protein